MPLSAAAIWDAKYAVTPGVSYGLEPYPMLIQPTCEAIPCTYEVGNVVKPYVMMPIWSTVSPMEGIEGCPPPPPS